MKNKVENNPFFGDLVKCPVTTTASFRLETLGIKSGGEILSDEAKLFRWPIIERKKQKCKRRKFPGVNT